MEILTSISKVTCSQGFDDGGRESEEHHDIPSSLASAGVYLPSTESAAKNWSDTLYLLPDINGSMKPSKQDSVQERHLHVILCKMRHLHDSKKDETFVCDSMQDETYACDSMQERHLHVILCKMRHLHDSMQDETFVCDSMQDETYACDSMQDETFA